MKKQGILHPELSRIVASLGHMDAIVIADAGLPIPAGPARIDLALVEGVPSFLSVLQAVLADVVIEGATLASEMAEASPELWQEVVETLGDVPVDTVPHSEFKALTREARAVVRTGEFTPYANVLLRAGVAFYAGSQRAPVSWQQPERTT
jgi:D-ribose pyranase